jgi:uncharacterized paraquat-inducible protein A
MRAYGKEIVESSATVTYRGREFALLGCTCGTCDYDFFVPALSEHEPSCCPNCGIRFVRVEPSAAGRKEG